MTRVATILLIVVAACDRRATITSCRDDLGGVWVAADQRWMVLDSGATLELYPLLADAPAGVLEVAPRVIDLEREDDRLAGTVRRRFMQRAATCTSKAPARITSCNNDAIEIVFADPQAPLAFEPCRFAPPPPSHRERWQRE
jgi:hypothetical protein